MWIGLIDLIRLDQDRDLICIKNLVSRLPQDLNFGSGLYCVFLSSDLDLDLESGFRIGIFFLFLDLDFCDFLHIVHLDLDLLVCRSWFGDGYFYVIYSLAFEAAHGACKKTPCRGPQPGKALIMELR